MSYEIPVYMQERVGEILAVEVNTASHKGLWAVILGLTPKLDGDQWCILWGTNLQNGIAGFGDSPLNAMFDFDKKMLEKQLGSEVKGDRR